MMLLRCRGVLALPLTPLRLIYLIAFDYNNTNARCHLPRDCDFAEILITLFSRHAADIFACIRR